MSESGSLKVRVKVQQEFQSKISYSDKTSVWVDWEFSQSSSSFSQIFIRFSPETKQNWCDLAECFSCCFFFFLYSGYRSAARSGISLQIEDLYFVCSICISLSLENSVFLDKITLTPSAPCEDDLWWVCVLLLIKFQSDSCPFKCLP